MSSDITMILIKGANQYDISELVERVVWSGKRDSPARTIQVNLVDFGEQRAKIDVEEGHSCIFKWKGNELFRGLITSQSDGTSKKASFKAHDNGIRLSNNDDTFSYKNKTATEIFIDICKRFGLKYDRADDSGYRIPELIKPCTSAWDALADALSDTFKTKGTRYYVLSKKGVLSFFRRRSSIIQWVIESGVNLLECSRDKSIENIKTRVKITSNEDTVLAEKRNTSLESKIGTFQIMSKVTEEKNSAQLNELVNSMLKEKGAPQRSLSLKALGIPDVISGVGVYIIVKPIGISGTYYVEEDSHTFSGRSHTMPLTLDYAKDI